MERKRRGYIVLSLSIALLFTALILSVVAMRVELHSGAIQREYNVSYNLTSEDLVLLFLNHDIPYTGIRSLNASLTHNCEKLYIELVSAQPSQPIVVSNITLLSGQNTTLTDLETIKRPFIFMYSDKPCKASIVYSYLIEVRPFAYLSIPAFILMMVGTVMFIYVLMYLVLIRVAERKIRELST